MELIHGTYTLPSYMDLIVEYMEHILHCEAGEGYWLQGEAALQAHSFRDADPQPVIPKKESGWNRLEIATITGYGWKCLDMDRNVF